MGFPQHLARIRQPSSTEVPISLLRAMVEMAVIGFDKAAALDLCTSFSARVSRSKRI